MFEDNAISNDSECIYSPFFSWCAFNDGGVAAVAAIVIAIDG